MAERGGPEARESRVAHDGPGDEPADTRQRSERRAPAVEAGSPRRDLVRWGPVVGGLVVTLATLVVLAVLGLAIGLSAFEPGEGGLADADTAATIWGILSVIVAFFLGGFTAARTAAVGGPEAGVVNGLMVGAAAIAVMVLLVGLGVGNTLGAAATNVEQIAEVIQEAQVDADEATAAAETAFENAEAGAWGTLIGLLLALGVAAAGGFLGRRPSSRTLRGNGHAGGVDASDSIV